MQKVIIFSTKLTCAGKEMSVNVKENSDVIEINLLLAVIVFALRTHANGDQLVKNL